MDEQLFKDDLVHSNRILYTPSIFAKANLLHLQETGELTSLKPHTSQREKLNSYLFFMVLEGEGKLNYEDETISLSTGQCVFLDCHKPYSHSSSFTNLWKLKWVHFNGPTMDGIYEKYCKRGGKCSFILEQLDEGISLLDELFQMASSDDIIKDMKIADILSRLLITLMETTVLPEASFRKQSNSKDKLLPLKMYLDTNFTERITLDDLSNKFFINKFYLTRLFKEQYGVSINTYINHKRITKAKELLRFSDLSIEDIGRNCGIGDPSYFTRLFNKIEGVTPKEYRKQW